MESLSRLSIVPPTACMHPFTVVPLLRQIPVVAAVEGVGQNMQSHPSFGIAFTLKEGSVLRTSETFNIEVLREYIINQTGEIAF